jgi:hypothetical protein
MVYTQQRRTTGTSRMDGRGISMRPTQFVKTPEAVEGYKVTNENFEEVARWCGGAPESESEASDHTDVSVCVRVPSLGGVQVASVGDYVYRIKANGRFETMNSIEFEKIYRPVTNTRDGNGEAVVIHPSFHGRR